METCCVRFSFLGLDCVNGGVGVWWIGTRILTRIRLAVLASGWPLTEFVSVSLFCASSLQYTYGYE